MASNSYGWVNPIQQPSMPQNARYASNGPMGQAQAAQMSQGGGTMAGITDGPGQLGQYNPQTGGMQNGPPGANGTYGDVLGRLGQTGAGAWNNLADMNTWLNKGTRSAAEDYMNNFMTPYANMMNNQQTQGLNSWQAQANLGEQQRVNTNAMNIANQQQALSQRGFDFSTGPQFQQGISQFNQQQALAQQTQNQNYGLGQQQNANTLTGMNQQYALGQGQNANAAQANRNTLTGMNQQYDVSKTQNANTLALGQGQNANAAQANRNTLTGMNQNFALGQGANANTAQANRNTLTGLNQNYALGQGANANQATQNANTLALGQGANANAAQSNRNTLMLGQGQNANAAQANANQLLNYNQQYNLGQGQLGLGNRSLDTQNQFNYKQLAQQAQLAREQQANDMMQSRYATFGHAQAPNARALLSFR